MPDGNTAAWMRPFTIMYSNSVLMMVDTAKYQWFYDRLIPWVHYVPLKRDLSDLYAKISWLRTHDDKAKWISKQGRLFVQNYLKMYQTREWSIRNFKLLEQAIHNPVKRNTTRKDWIEKKRAWIIAREEQTDKYPED